MYLTQPSLHRESLYFICEDNLWRTNIEGGVARRLTADIGTVHGPVVSPDGRKLAFTCTQEGARDVYIMPSAGGHTIRLTWIGESVRALGFTPDSEQVLFSSSHSQPDARQTCLYQVPSTGGVPAEIPVGPVTAWQQHHNTKLLCRHSTDLAHWKRYRGGRVGQIWISHEGAPWRELPSLGGNVATPALVSDAVYFVSDHLGSANIFRCDFDGGNVEQCTFHEHFAVRSLSLSGGQIAYGFRGEIWLFSIDTRETCRVQIHTASPEPRAQRRHVAASRFLESVSVHPGGHSIVATLRGKPFVGGLWEGPLQQLGAPHGVRYRLSQFLSEDKIVWVADETGDERIQVFDGTTLTARTVGPDLGRIQALIPYSEDMVAVITISGVLGVLNLNSGVFTVVAEKASAGPPSGATWSADGAWLAWSEPLPGRRSGIRLANVAHLAEPDADSTITVHNATEGSFYDHSPDFDPLGRFLYFLSDREFDPVPDQIYFGYSFPRGSKPYLLTLRSGLPSPFEPRPHPFKKQKPPKPPATFQIDVDTLPQRILPFPVPESHYSHVLGLPSGNILLCRSSVSGASQRSWRPGRAPDAKKILSVWEAATNEHHTVYGRVSSLTLDLHRTTVAVQSGYRLRVFPADADKAKRALLKKVEPYRARRQSHWVDLGRARLVIEPRQEWRQMLIEAWRLMRDHYWECRLAKVDWDAVRARYVELVDRVSTRAELADLIKCMQGETGTSHSYELGGDYRPEVRRAVGRLGIDVRWDDDAWMITKVYQGDPGTNRSSPMLKPGVEATVGTKIYSVAGRPVQQSRPLEADLVGHANRPVAVEISDEEARRSVWVRPLARSVEARYRTWVRENRNKVHTATDGRAGYVHIPNMGPTGFADFHRDYLSECTHDSLIVDIRFNRGGHVSQLILARLMQRRLAYVHSRYYGITPYPRHTVLGPMVCLANELSGSDGDIFAQNWKELGLGPLVGTRTWGGVVGISPRFPLVDQGLTTQPEFAYWFNGPGFGIEGHGVSPDIEVRYTPNDWAQGADPQLFRAIDELQRLLATAAGVPTIGPLPDRSS